MLVLTAPNLSAEKNIAHGFFGRQGGVSTGIFTSLNCGPGSGDARTALSENRARVAAHLLPGAPLLTLHQIHSSKAMTVTTPWPMGEGPEADAMVTDKPGHALGILTADCAPVLFADSEARVIGAAHAGWKGAIGGVLESTLAAMESLGAARTRIMAAIGPCIGGANYEVGPEFKARFDAADPANARYFAPSPRAHHWLFDLEAYVAARLDAAGIAATRLSACTYAREGDFFSFRRATHRGESGYGRQVSAILLTDK
jgi:YfiH family protein